MLVLRWNQSLVHSSIGFRPVRAPAIAGPVGAPSRYLTGDEIVSTKEVR
jgi:hypothetical protein